MRIPHCYYVYELGRSVGVRHGKAERRLPQLGLPAAIGDLRCTFLQKCRANEKNQKCHVTTREAIQVIALKFAL